MSNFDTAVITLLRHEGIDSWDAVGGQTKYGISLRWLLSEIDHADALFADIDFNHDGIIDAADVKKMSLETAMKLYRIKWWDRNEYDKVVQQPVATKLLTMTVNMGARQSHKLIQRAIRSATGEQLAEDGVLGNKTLAAINSSNSNDLLAAYRSECAGFYRSLNKPKYINGWLNRAYDR